MGKNTYGIMGESCCSSIHNNRLKIERIELKRWGKGRIGTLRQNIGFLDYIYSLSSKQS
jgi:hypothetical protein